MLRDIISDRESTLPVSTIGRMLKIAAESKSVISLGPGEPDFGSPTNVLKESKMAIERGMTHYSPISGRADLKKAIARKLRKDNDIRASEESVIVTSGSTEAIMLALMATIDPGEAVMLPDPGFLSYKPTVEVLNGVPISIPLYKEEGFQLNTDVMDKLIIPEKTRVLILNSPSNPTGTVLNRKVMEEVADFVTEHNLLVISDEAYEKFVYGGSEHISIGSLNGMEESVLTLQSFSKTYAMPGFRLGYGCGPPEIIRAMTKLHVFSSLTAPTISQIAGTGALNGPQKSVERMRKEYDRRRKMIIKRIGEVPGWECTEPRGAFYAFPDTSSMGMKSLETCEWLLKEAKVATIPGTEFGKCGEGFLRLSYATSYEKIERAMDRIDKAVMRRKK